ncbi:MAG: retention module-containing protein, partial [Betaproteobacteria bacterium]|nr:retention module-containing protein [Betaproteobacteria bacterium]
MTKTTFPKASIKPIGTVKALVGNATAVDANGVKRVLHIGDKVYPNEIIQTDVAGGTVHIEFVNAGFATLASGQTLALDHTFFQGSEKQASAVDIQSLQAKIAAGEDPSEFMESAAAGPSAGGDDDQGGHQFVVVQQSATRGNITPGFDTATFDHTYRQIESNAGIIKITEDNGIDNSGAGSGDGNGNGNGGSGDGSGGKNNGTYDARAIIERVGTDANTVSFNLLAVDRAVGTASKLSGSVDYSITFNDPAAADWFKEPTYDAATGKITLTLSDEGIKALTDSNGNNLYAYITIVVNGQPYTMQVIVNPGNTYHADAEDARNVPTDGSLIFGEWHEGKELNDASITSSNLSDEITFKGTVSNSSINAREGDNTVTITVDSSDNVAV